MMHSLPMWNQNFHQLISLVPRRSPNTSLLSTNAKILMILLFELFETNGVSETSSAFILFISTHSFHSNSYLQTYASPETSEVVYYFLIIRAWPDESHSFHLCHILDTKYPRLTWFSKSGEILNCAWESVNIPRVWNSFISNFSNV